MDFHRKWLLTNLYLGSVYTNPDSVVNVSKSIRFELLFTLIQRKQILDPYRFENEHLVHCMTWQWAK